MAVFSCAECGHSQAVDPKHVGRSATCPKCKAQGTVVADAGVVPDSAPSDPSAPTVHRKIGDRMGIASDSPNEKSELRREWIILDDPRLPIGFDLEKTLGISTGQKWNGHSIDYRFTTRTCLNVRHEAITALEIRHLTFDVWGDHVRTLSGTEIADHNPSSIITLDHVWNLYSFNEAWDFYASITYLAMVRTKGGKVIKAETDAVLREAQRFSEKFSAEQLEPTPKKT